MCILSMEKKMFIPLLVQVVDEYQDMFKHIYLYMSSVN